MRINYFLWQQKRLRWVERKKGWGREDIRSFLNHLLLLKYLNGLFILVLALVSSLMAQALCPAIWERRLWTENSLYMTMALTCAVSLCPLILKVLKRRGSIL